jgi:hypothetical protein
MASGANFYITKDKSVSDQKNQIEQRTNTTHTVVFDEIGGHIAKMPHKVLQSLMDNQKPLVL